MEVSIALTTYNGEKYLQQQLESILSQTILPDEVVIKDDNSSDSTISILEKFKKDSPFHVTIEQNKDNLGSIKNFEEAIKKCTGKIILLSDQDDIWEANRIETSINLLESNPDYGFLFSNALLIDEQNKIIDGNLWESVGFTESKQHSFSNIELQATELRSLNIVTGATLAFRSDLKKYFLPFPKELKNYRRHHDGWIAIRLSLLGFYGLHCSHPLIRYRKHNNQQVGISAGNTPIINKLRLIDPRESIKSELSLINLFLNQENFDRPIDDNIKIRIYQLNSRLEILNQDRFKRIFHIVEKYRRKDYFSYKYPSLSAIKDFLY